MKLIFEILGVPSVEDASYVTRPNAQKFVNSFRVLTKPPLFASMFQDVAPETLSLLQGLLHFNPSLRLTAEQALAHPYFGFLRDPTDEPVCPVPFRFHIGGLNSDEIMLKIDEFVHGYMEEDPLVLPGAVNILC